MVTDGPDIYDIQKRLAILMREINEELHALWVHAGTTISLQSLNILSSVASLVYQDLSSKENEVQISWDWEIENQNVSQVDNALQTGASKSTLSHL